jgi:spermidine synthase
MGYFFILFFASGFCSILYEVIWLRLAMTQFGVTSAITSIVISAFMAGIGIGSLLSGRYIRLHENQIRSPAKYYAVIELLIGLSAICVPYQFLAGHTLLSHIGFTSLLAFNITAGVWIALTLIPWCMLMGATFSFAMLTIKHSYTHHTQHSFSYLYLANVSGAMLGTILPLLLIELAGFHATLFAGAAINFSIALTAAILRFPQTTIRSNNERPQQIMPNAQHSSCLTILFLTGLTSMGMEIVWIRLYVPFLGTVVYAFAAILGIYLLCTFLGSQIYRYRKSNQADLTNLFWLGLGCTSLLPLLFTYTYMPIENIMRLLIGIGPFSCLLGYITPLLVDRWSQGIPERAAYAYAINIAGCILGPLLAGFILLPLLDERWVIYLFALPWFLLSFTSNIYSETYQRYVSAALSLIVFVMVFNSPGYLGFSNRQTHFQILRDHTATVVASGEGKNKLLQVNGYGMTMLSNVTKVMAHLPLAFLDHTPRNALVVCFGMGTTYRSLLSWGIDTTAVELVPSVPMLFSYFHHDASKLIALPNSHIIIDDGRHYLAQSTSKYDVITIDPPPPVAAAGSGLLYTIEFYAIINKRLQPDGIVQQWLPHADVAVQVAVTRAIVESFPYVRIFRDGLGLHFIASHQKINNYNASELANHLPDAARADLIEWSNRSQATDVFNRLLQNEVSANDIINQQKQIQALSDDKPINEYYLLRERDGE